MIIDNGKLIVSSQREMAKSPPNIFRSPFSTFNLIYADVAKLAYAPDLGSGASGVQVQLLSSAPNSKNPNLVPIGEGFGFFITIIIPNSAGQNQKEVVAK